MQPPKPKTHPDEDDISHHAIYDRLCKLEQKVDRVDYNTQGVVAAFQSAKGAFIVLDFIGKLAKPVLWIIGLSTAIAVLWNEWFRR